MIDEREPGSEFAAAVAVTRLRPNGRARIIEALSAGDGTLAGVGHLDAAATRGSGVESAETRGSPGGSRRDRAAL